jgi:hypothetical protein
MGWITIQKRVVLRDVRSFDFELCVICSRDDVLDVMKTLHHLRLSYHQLPTPGLLHPIIIFPAFEQYLWIPVISQSYLMRRRHGSVML